MIRSIGGVVAGYVTMVVLVMIGTSALVAALVPGGLATMKTMRDTPQAMPLTKAYLVGNLVLSLAAAVAGSWVMLRVAPDAPNRELLALVAVIVMMGVVSARMEAAEFQPSWYRIAIPLVGILGVALSQVLFVARVVS